jgi:hypothetical protein
LRVGMHILATLRRLYGDEVLAWREEAYEYVKDQLAIDLLFGGPEARELIDDAQGDAQGDVDELWRAWQLEAEAFKEARAPHLLYPS